MQSEDLLAVIEYVNENVIKMDAFQKKMQLKKRKLHNSDISIVPIKGINEENTINKTVHITLPYDITINCKLEKNTTKQDLLIQVLSSFR